MASPLPYSLGPFSPWPLTSSQGLQPLLLPQTLASPAAPSSPLHDLSTHRQTVTRFCLGLRMRYKLHFLGTTGLTPAFCVTITAGRGPSCLGSLGERIQFWKETGCGWDLGLGRRPRLLRGAHGWLWCQPTCHREVPTSYHRDGSAASEQSGAPGGAGKVFVPRGPLSSSGSRKRRRRRRVSSHELFLQ